MKCGICVCGLNGSGKATLAGALAKELNFKHIDIEKAFSCGRRGTASAVDEESK